MPLIDWRPGPYSDFGRATASNGGPKSSWLTVGSDGLFREDGAPFVVAADHYIETICGFMSDADVDGAVKHSAAYGINFVRFLGWNNKAVATTGLYNLGCWTDPSGTGANNGLVVYGATYNEAFLVQMDKTIAKLNERGIRIWFGFEHFRNARIVAGLAPNSANGTQATCDSNGDHGMIWSATHNAVCKDHISTILNRVNTQTGIAYKDNPMISVVAAFNENSFWDAATKNITDATYGVMTGIDYIVNEIGGTGGGPTGGSGWWRAELDADWLAYGAANGITWPTPRYPLAATWNAWSAADRRNMIAYICDRDYAAAVEYRDFIKSLMPNVLYVYDDGTRYQDMRIQSVCDSATLHAYAKGNGGTSRLSVLDDTSSITNSWGFYSQRLAHQPQVTTENGDGSGYSSRNDYDTHWFRATISSLQRAAGQMYFCAWQNQYYAAANGNSAGHYMAVYPSRRLSALFSTPIIKHRLIGEIASERVFVIDPASNIARIEASNANIANINITQTGERVAATPLSPGVTLWQWLKDRVYTEFGTPENIAADTTYDTAAIQAGISIATTKGTLGYKGAGVSDPRMTWNFPAVMGVGGHVDNFTAGKLTISGLSASYRGIAAIRSSGPWDIGAGPSVLFLHGPTFRSDCSVNGNSSLTNIDDFMAGDGLTITGGTSANTRLFVPAAVTITLSDIGRKQRVYGLSVPTPLADTVTSTLVPSTWNAATGTLTFTSDPQYPAYHIEPDDAMNGSVGRQWSRQRGGVRQ